MLPYRDSRFTIIALGVFFLIAILYALFEARGQLLGPTINVDTRVSIVQDPFLIIEGEAKRISSLTMNGKPIQVTESGAFREPYLLAPGYNRIVLNAKDSYGRSAEKMLEIMYEVGEEATPSPPTGQASTTPEESSSPLQQRATTTVDSIDTAATTTP